MIRLGKPAPRRVSLVSPRQLVVRRSSDVLAINDPVVSSALRIIQREAYTGLNVEKLLDKMTISRATLERRFERFLGRSPKDENRSLAAEPGAGAARRHRRYVGADRRRNGFQQRGASECGIQTCDIAFSGPIPPPPPIYRQITLTKN